MKIDIVPKIKRNFKIVILIANLLISGLGLLTLIAIYNYKFSQSDSKAIYARNLSEKTALDRWAIEEDEYNKLTKEGKKMGEIRLYFKGDELVKGNINPFNNKVVTGTILSESNVYNTEINPLNLDFNRKDKHVPYQWQWDWYNWLGVGLKN